ncbi:MAG TPA: ABC transporter ATP-binding protein [Myxococcaceae bacterium]|nr:ABC transporter ATP-binding protein [Myxococcaceae bacterium]
MSDVVRFDDVHVLFRSRVRAPVWALRGFTLGVPEGAVMGLLGPNGAGKTTCISCILALLEPHRGSAYLWGEPALAARPTPERRCGALLEDTRLPPFLPVSAALRTVCALRGVAQPARELERVHALCGTGDLATRTVATLSKGQARKVGLAAAMIADPPLLILDEPSAGLDAEARVEFDALLRRLKNGKRTLLIASHLLGDVEATCSHIAVVREGRVLLTGKAEDLLAEARRGRSSDVHVDAAAGAQLGTLGIGFETSRYPGLVALRTELADEALFAALAWARIVPRRVEPKVSVLSVYLDVTRREGEAG